MSRETGSLVDGRYRLVAVLGEGGMGAAWRAHDERMRRDVVLKQLRVPPGLDPAMRAQLIARMEREGRAAGMLKHPNIVTVHDQFADEDGLPWIVMELVNGPSLDQVVRERGPLPEPEAARIGAGIAAALRAAHQAGIVHRDVKPANVLLEGPRVVVTDFGIAALAGETTLTVQGMLLGTPAYMAPEQINDSDATPASDVWALGATLYTAVEGRPAFTGGTTAALLLAVSRGKPAPTERANLLKPVLRDLMRVEPARRPTSAAAIAALERAASGGLPAQATNPGVRPDQTRTDLPGRPRTIGRRGLLIGLGAGGAALVAAGGAGGAVYLATRGGDSFPRWNRTPTAAGTIDVAMSVRSLAFRPDGKALATGSSSSDDTARLWDVDSRTALGPALQGHTGTVHSVAFSPDGKTLATGSYDNTARFWDVSDPASAHALGSPLTAHTADVDSVAFSPDGRLLATASDDKSVLLWDVARQVTTGVALTGHTGLIWMVAFSPDGRTIGTGSADGTARLWSVDRRAQVGASMDHGADKDVWSVAFSPDGKLLATGGDDGTVRLWSTATHQVVATLTGHTQSVYSVAFSPDGLTLVSGSTDKTFRLWDVKARALIGTPMTAHTGQVCSVAFTRDGKLLATGSDDKTVHLWKP